MVGSSFHIFCVETKKEKIVELLESIETRLAELEAEKEELGEFFQLDRERKGAEYLLHSRELEKASNALARLEEEFQSVLTATGVTEEEDEAQFTRLRQMESQLGELRRSIQDLQGEVSSHQEDLESLGQSKTRLELVIGDLEEDSARFRGEESRIEAILAEVEQEIEAKELALGQLVPRTTHMESSEQELRQRLAQVSQQRQSLLAKKSRLGQFRTEADRNRWLTKEIEGLTQSRQLDVAQQSNLNDELESCLVREGDLREALQLAEANDPMAKLQELDLEYQDARRERDRATEQRKELWRAQAKLESGLGSISEELDTISRDATCSASDRSALQSIDAVTRIAHRLGLQLRCHGPLYSLFTLSDPVFTVAADTIGGGSLYHVVVDDEHVASELMEVLVKEKAGRVTFMPLSRLTSKGSSIEYGPNAVSLLSRLQYDQRFAPAMQHVFGKAVVCKDLQTGALLSREHQVDAITLTGDRVSRKGALTGGSTDTKRGTNRLGSLMKVQQWQAKRSEHQDLLRSVKDRLVSADQQVTLSLGRMQLLECQREDLRIGATRSSNSAQQKTELASLQAIIASKRASLLLLGDAIRAADQKIEALGHELDSPFQSELNANEVDSLAALTASFEQLNGEYSRLNSELSAALQQQGAIETDLESNLRRRRHALTTQLCQVSTSHLAQSIRLHNEELVSLQNKIQLARSSYDRASTRMTSLLAEESALVGALETARSILDREDDRSAEHQQRTKYSAKRKMLLQQRQEAAERVRELGAVPEDAINQLRSLPNAVLLSRLHDAKDKLRQAGPVNKKATEQHASFAKQSAALNTRLTELTASATAIQDFIRVLDSRKDEAIQRTFDQVSDSFSMLFARLVPTGHAALEMLRTADDQGELQFSGISLKASFNSTEADEGLLLQQLSGGQKSLVSLALILAIQQTDPAPFYLFDEVDAALDSAHRTALSSLLDSMAHPIPSDGEKDQSPPSLQFICTTFRPEMLQRADKFFGVAFGSRVSRVQEISQEQALDFVETETKI